MTCPACGGHPTLLGQLASLIWLRCRQCGIDWNVKAEDIEDIEDTD